MIYTICCKRDDCGGMHSSKSEEGCNVEAKIHGWKESFESGWLCPFHAPKEAAKTTKSPNDHRRTLCERFECLNLCDTTEPGQLTASGWHNVITEPNGTLVWYCPACWKTTQPEPMPIFDQAEAMHAAEFSIDQVKEIAAEVAKKEIRAFVTSLSIYRAAIGGQYSAQALLEAMEDMTEPESTPAFPEETGTKENPYAIEGQPF